MGYNLTKLGDEDTIKQASLGYPAWKRPLGGRPPAVPGVVRDFPVLRGGEGQEEEQNPHGLRRGGKVR